MRPRRAALLGVAIGLVAVACGKGSRPTPSPRAGRGPFNVLIVVLDACRADKLGCYGFERETSPSLDALAKDADAIVFRRHYVQGTWTKPSVASLFTGLYVFQHGVLMDHQRGRGGKRGHPLFKTQILAPSYETLAERFGKAGFFTFGIVKSFQIAREYGFDQGFDRYYLPDEIVGDAARVAETLELVRTSPKRFLGYLHLEACHNPFTRGERSPEYMSRYGFPYDEASRAAAGVDFGGIEIKFAIREKRVTLTPDDVRFLHLAYEAKLRRADETLVAPLLRGLRETGHYDDTLLIVTADHGEELYDHGGYHHGYALWEELTHVPLIVKFPKGRRPAGLGSRVDDLTQSVDILPSLLALAGLPPDPRLPGAPALEGSFKPFALSEILGGGWALVQSRYKLIEEAGGRRLFDLEADPGERRDLSAADPTRAQAMLEAAGQLKRVIGAGPEAPVIETELKPEALEALRSLGYIR